VLHIAEQSAGLLPDDANARARAVTWMFAALNTVEPPILELATAILEGDKHWRAESLPMDKDRVRERLGKLSVRLGDADWLDGAFSAGDLMMVSVLLRLRPLGLLDEYPNLATYVARGEARPAYSAALEVGYESVSQFTREYARMFGAPPKRDMLRRALSARSRRPRRASRS
jgi:glutathione S-transferase